MIRRAQPWLGTLVEISVRAEGGLAEQAINAAFMQVALAHRLMSFHDADSDVSRINLAAPDALLSVDEHTWQVLQLAQEIGDASGGIFNIACAPRLVAWGCLPPPAAPLSFDPHLAVLCCEEGGTVRKLAPGWIDLGGIAKGYAVDLAIAALCEAGIGSACVNAGGDLRVLGSEPWPVAVRDPQAPLRTGKLLQVADSALATSAAYFTTRRHEDQQVCALLDGRSGEPLPNCASVTVQAPRCVAADALTKIVFASGNPHHPALRVWDATAFII